MAKRHLPPFQRPQPQSPESVLCVSYWPLLDPQAGLRPGVALSTDRANLDHIEQIIASLPEVRVLGVCLFNALSPDLV
jgi:hypothetical protein